MEKIKVINRSDHMVAYSIESLRVHRVWYNVNDYIMIPEEEIEEALMNPSIKKLFDKYLIIDNKEVFKDLNGYEPEPEYFYGRDEIAQILYSADDNALLDCLDYCNEGTLDLIKKMSIEKLPNTVAKIEAINAKLNINLQKIKALVEDDDNEVEEPEVKTRRTTPIITKKEENKSRYTVKKD